MRRLTANPRERAGWIVVASVTAILTATSGARFLYGVVLKPVTEEFDWSRTDLTVAVVINMVFLSAMQPVIGGVVDRLGSRRVLGFGIVALVAILVPMSFASKLWQFYLLWGVLSSIGLAATSPVNTTKLVSGWFRERRGTALSIATSGSAFGQLLIVPLATLTLTLTDWRTVYRALAVILLVVMLPLCLRFVREAPPETHASETHPARRSPALDATASVGLRDALNSSAFWLLAFGFFVCGFTMAFANTHFLAYADDMGMGNMEAADIVAATALFSILGSIALGMAADRWPRSMVLALTYALRGAAFVCLFFLPSGPQVYLYAIVLGISWTATTPITAAISADLYGQANIGVIFGTMFTFMNIGFGAGSFLDGVVYDATGSYDVALLINAALGALAAVAVLQVSDRASLPERRREPALPAAEPRVGAAD